VSPQLISRRSTLRAFAVSIGGAVAGFVVARTSGAASPKGSTTAANGYGAHAASGGKLLARVDQVPSGGGLILANDKIVLTSGPGGTVHGFSAVCTHQGCTVGSVSGGAITCPCHGSQFNDQTGAVISGPAQRPLPKIPVVVRNNSVFTG
jgi:Rieske Fe-S protein